MTKAPIAFLLGEADDFTPAGHCIRYADFFRDKGANVLWTTFANAHHGFDLPTPPQFLPRVQSARNCGLDIELEPVVGRRWDTGAEVPASGISSYLRACMQRGATYGGNAVARDKAIQHVNDIVTMHLLPQR